MEVSFSGFAWERSFMRRIYLVRKDPDRPVSRDNWLVMNRNEFLKFIASDEGKRRASEFGKLNACGYGDYMIVAECGCETAARWRKEKDREDRLRRTEKEMRTSGRLLSLDIETGDEEQITFKETIADPSPQVSERVQLKLDREPLNSAIRSLSRREQDLVEEMYLSESPVSELQFAERSKLSRAAVHNRKLRALGKLRSQLEREFPERGDG